MHEQINKCNDLAHSTKDRRKLLMERDMKCWRLGDDELAEWHEYKGDESFEYAVF